MDEESTVERFIREVEIPEANKAEIEKVVVSQGFKQLIYSSLLKKLRTSQDKDAVSVLAECRALAELLTIKKESKSVTTTKI